MKKIGLGNQEFSKFHRENLIYVDKTEIIHQLVNSGTKLDRNPPRTSYLTQNS